MIRTTTIAVAGAALMALAGGLALAPQPAVAAGGWDCRDHPDRIVKGSPPVESFYCPAPKGSPEPVQLDVYIFGTRNGPAFLPCATPPTPADVVDEFC